MTRLLVVHHSPSSNTAALREALVAGTRDESIQGVEVTVRAAFDATSQDINDADGVLLLTPANFGYMSGLTKDLFDRTFLDIGGSLSGDGSAAGGRTGVKLYCLCVHGRYDVTGAVNSVQNIVKALPWRPAAPVLEVLGDVTDEDKESAYELGGTLAALLSA